MFHASQGRGAVRAWRQEPRRNNNGGIDMDQITAFLHEYYNKRIAGGSLADAFDFFNAVKIPTEDKT